MRNDGGEPTRMAVLASLFLVRGPFGLGGLWKSERFERREKLILTVAVLVYTVALVAAVCVAGAAVCRNMTLP